MKNFSFCVAAISFAAVTVVQSESVQAQLRSFGEAEGYGAVATGGRAGTTIYHVTNLNDSGVGSLRDAVNGSNRIIVFDVAGEIKLTTGGISCQSNITIAGQTAPGAGITITGAQALGFTSRTNVIVRYLRLRPGDSSPASDNGMSMTRTGTAILDHVSIEFGKYNNIDAVAQTADAPRITIQNSIIADPISTGTSNRGQGFGSHLEAVNGYYTLSNNLWANSHSRNPLAKVNEQFKNNIEYNNETGYLTSGTDTAFKHDLVNNAFIAGPDYTSSSDYGDLSTPDKFYEVGNVLDSVRDGMFDSSAISNPVLTTDARYSATPLHASTASLPTLSVDDAYTYVLAHAGVSQARDQLDNLVVSQVKTNGLGTAGYTAGTTGPISSVVPFDTAHEGLYNKANLTGLPNGGLGVTAASSRVVYAADGVTVQSITGDADKDGVADTWEAVHGMSSSNASDALKLNPLGYLMIEQYINELGATNDSVYSNIVGDWNNATTWQGGAVPNAMNYAKIRGNNLFTANVTLNGAGNAMELGVGGNGSVLTDTFTVGPTATLNVYDTITVGEQGNATASFTGGVVNAYNIILGNTLSGTTYTGTLNMTGGTLSLSQLVLGGGTPGSWTTGGSMNWTGGTIKAVGDITINVPIALGAGGGTLDSNGFSGTVSGNLTNVLGQAGTFTKKGLGTVTMTGHNTFSGTTTVQAGVLAINGTSNFSPVNITGGTLQGSGTIFSLTLGASGTLAPGNSIGTLTVLQNAALSGILTEEVSGTGTGSADKLVVGGNLNLTGATVNFSTLVALDDAAYVVATYTSLTGTFANVGALPSGYRINYAFNGNQIALVPVPEPTAMILLMGSLPIMLRRRSRA